MLHYITCKTYIKYSHVSPLFEFYVLQSSHALVSPHAHVLLGDQYLVSRRVSAWLHWTPIATSQESYSLPHFLTM